MSVTSPPPPVSPGRSFRTAVYFGKEFGGRTLVGLSLDSCMQAMRMFLEWKRDDNSCIQRKMQDHAFDI